MSHTHAGSTRRPTDGHTNERGNDSPTLIDNTRTLSGHRFIRKCVLIRTTRLKREEVQPGDSLTEALGRSAAETGTRPMRQTLRLEADHHVTAVRAWRDVVSIQEVLRYSTHTRHGVPPKEPREALRNHNSDDTT